MSKVSPRFARIVTAPDGAQLLVYLYLSERGTFLHHTMMCGQIQLDMKIGPYPYRVAYELLFEHLDEQKMIEQFLADPVKAFNIMTQGGTIGMPNEEKGDKEFPKPSLN
jgi:phage-related protein